MKKPNVVVIGLKGLPAFGGAATVGENLIEQLYEKYNFTVYSVASHTCQNGKNEKYYQKVFREFPIKKFNIFMYYLKSAIHSIFFSKYSFVHLHHVDGAFILPLLRIKYKVINTSHARPQEAEKWPIVVKYFFRLNEKIAFKMADVFTTVAEPLKNTYSNLTSREILYSKWYKS